MGENRIDNLREELGEEETTEETQETEAEETSEEETEEEESETSEEEENKEEEETEKTKSEFEMPEKFKGKTAEQIAQSYQELEKLIGQRALGKEERKDLKDAGMGRKDLGSMEEMQKLIEGTDFTKMTAPQFAQWLVEITDKRATERAREIYTTASTVQKAVQTEIGEAVEKFPLLKSNKEFRSLTLAVIEADAARGETTPIIQAAQKVTALMATQKQAEEAKKNEGDRKRTAVEGAGSGAGDKKDTEEEKVLKGLMGGNPGGPMGGLGI